MIILWIIMWFIAGFLMTLAICNFKKRREMEKALMERLMLHKALCEKTPDEINILCTTLGFSQAYKSILNDYKIKNGYKI